jgi:predicted TPR repeat methyltransferase
MTAEHMPWMFCPVSASGVLDGVGVLDPVLAVAARKLSEAGTLLEAAREGADDDAGVELEEVVGVEACCCVVVVVVG